MKLFKNENGIWISNKSILKDMAVSFLKAYILMKILNLILIFFLICFLAFFL